MIARATSTAGAAWDRPIWASSSRSASVSGRRGSFLRRDMAASLRCRRPSIVAERRALWPQASHLTHYNLVYREEEREMNPLCRDEGIGLIPWSPLARGFLA